jgi:hypothetical protein
MAKSNLFAYVELKKLVENLNQSQGSLKESLLTQAAYFHILDPKYFSEELAPEWVDIRRRLGYTSEEALQGQQFLKNALQETIRTIPEAECREMVAKVKKLLHRLNGELEG